MTSTRTDTASPATESQQASTPAREFHPNSFVHRMRLLFDGPNSDIQNILGYCHGLVLRWGLSMAERAEEKFFNSLKLILDITPTKPRVSSLLTSEEFKTSIAQIEYAQHIDFYTKDEMNHVQVAEIMQRMQDVTWTDRNNQSVEWREQAQAESRVSLKESKIATYDKTSLYQLLASLDLGSGNMVVITTLWSDIDPTRDDHSIGVFYRDKHFYVFGFGLTEESVIVLNNPDDAVEYVLAAHYSIFDYEIPADFHFHTYTLQVESSAICDSELDDVPLDSPYRRFYMSYPPANEAAIATQTAVNDKKIADRCLFGAKPLVAQVPASDSASDDSSESFELSGEFDTSDTSDTSDISGSYEPPTSPYLSYIERSGFAARTRRPANEAVSPLIDSRTGSPISSIRRNSFSTYGNSLQLLTAASLLDGSVQSPPYRSRPAANEANIDTTEVVTTTAATESRDRKRNNRCLFGRKHDNDATSDSSSLDDTLTSNESSTSSDKVKQRKRS